MPSYPPGRLGQAPRRDRLGVLSVLFRGREEWAAAGAAGAVGWQQERRGGEMRGCRWDAVGGGRPPLRLRRPRAPPGLVLVQGARGCDGTGMLPWAADQTVGLNRVRSVRRASLCGCSGLQAPWTGAEAGGGRLQARTTAFQSHLSHCVSGRAPTLPDPRVLKNGSRVRATSRHRERIGSAALRPAGI